MPGLQYYFNTCSGTAYNTYRAWKKRIGPLRDYLPTDRFSGWKERWGDKWGKTRKKKSDGEEAPFPWPDPPPDVDFRESSSLIYLKGAIWSVCVMLFLLGQGLLELALFLDSTDVIDFTLAVWDQVFQRDFPEELTDNIRDSDIIKIGLRVLTRVLFVLGSFIRFSAILGVGVAYFNMRCLNQIYTLYVLAMAAGLGAMIWFKERVVDELEPYLYSSLKTYDGWNSTNLATVFWNVMHTTWACCGVNGYEDFLKLDDWPNDPDNPDNLMTPISCCVNVTASNVSCAQTGGNATTENNYMEQGCFEYLKDFLETYWVIAYVPGVLFVPFALLFIGMMALLLTSEYDLHSKKDD